MPCHENGRPGVVHAEGMDCHMGTLSIRAEWGGSFLAGEVTGSGKVCYGRRCQKSGGKKWYDFWYGCLNI